jgi:hypothetical protein
MSGSYSFLPWTRQGLINRIGAQNPANLRATVEVKIELTARQLDGTDAAYEPKRNVQLYGPGDVIGLDARSVIRMEPRNWVTNFEPNYLAAIEFYDEDLPWRYTPAQPDAAGARLPPWIMLIVLEEQQEFEEGQNAKDRPLPYITLKNNARQAAFPDPGTLWAWAHVHVNRGLTASDSEIVASDRDVVAIRLDATVKEDADLAYSRIVCPRRFEPNKTYHAFVIPAFESGRLAGLGLDPSLAPNALASAWTSNGSEPDNFPVYFRWQFRTGAIGDFEYLVRLLQPRPVDKRVGVRGMDVQRPGANVPGISDPDLHGVLQLGGALRVPRKSLNTEELAVVQQQENWAQPYPHPFQQRLAALINLADDYSSKPASQANAGTDIPSVSGDPDPVVTPPLYARWHALTNRLLVDSSGNPVPNASNWVHELNLDPRFRVPAGFGTRVVQAKQEDLMAAAWEQIGDVLEANRRIRRFMFAQQVSFRWHQIHLQPIVDQNPGKALLLTAPVHARVLARSRGEGTTMKAWLGASSVPAALVAPTMRRLTRPRSRLMRSLPFDTRIRPDNLIDRVNSGEVKTAPPKVTPPGVVTVANLAAGGLPSGIPDWLIEYLRKFSWLAYAPLVVGLIFGLLLSLIGLSVWVAGALVAIGAASTVKLVRLLNSIRRADSLGEDQQTPNSVDELPASPDFKISEPDSSSATVTLTPSGTDSPEAARFKLALKDLNTLLQASLAADKVGENGPPRLSLDLIRDAAVTLKAIDPATTIPRRAEAIIRIPPRIRGELPEAFVEAMAYPVFDIPMYRPLSDLSADLLIPNVNLIENNSVTLLETNQKFVEAYMVGLNHEFARELLWREYPTDQRGSYFRQFWDVSSFFVGNTTDDEALREKLRDILPLHRWPRTSKLGDHDSRERPGDNEEEVVLAIRGELLKRYPNAVIYAQAAEWSRLPNGDIDRGKERRLVEISASEENNPPRSKLRTPLYEAKIDPDIYFFGFDLTIPDAKGGTGENRDDPAGWFFVIKERPGEPRFGFDETSDAQIIVWNDLGWDRVPMAGPFIRPIGGNTPLIPAASPAGQEEKEPQRLEDVQIRWNNDVSAAELAYVMYQAPVMVAIHAAEMLPAK